MKKVPFSLDQLSKPAAKPTAPRAAKKAPVVKPTAWGQGVLKKIEEFRLALALEK